MSIEKYLIDHCASTLASLKMANMFNMDYECEQDLFAHLRAWNEELNSKGVFVTVLRLREGGCDRSRRTALIYVYRAKYLAAALSSPETAAFLQKYGYDEGLTVAEALTRLREHMAEEDFPHEIGVFLGYPLADVIGFIENGGRNCVCSGCWKVYCNQQEAEKMFCKIRKCRTVYRQMWEQGRSVLQLTVSR
ncbi:MAG: DUF3793 family protein [Firmicutes bacterium]|nr:DUF3793 family protein [Bacillota bacterium]